MSTLRTRARAMRNNPTDAERVLWRQLRLWQLGGYKFRRQQPLGRYIVDFVCLEKRVIIEVDGGQHAQTPEDEERDTWFAKRRICRAEILEQRGFAKLPCR